MGDERVRVRLPARLAVATCLAATTAHPVAAEPALREIVPPRARVFAGGYVEFRAMPPSPVSEPTRSTSPAGGVTPPPTPTPDRRADRWELVGSGVIERDGTYRAPYVVPRNGSSARIVCRRGGKAEADSAEARVELLPSVFPGAADCLGEGQAWDAAGRLSYLETDELLSLVHPVLPVVPPGFPRDSLDARFVVRALVCRSGRVIDAYALRQNIHPKLERAAIEAVRQYEFRPAILAGHPVAVMVDVPIRFSSH